MDAVLDRHAARPARAASPRPRCGLARRSFWKSRMALREASWRTSWPPGAASGRVLQVGFNRRFAPTYLRLKAQLRWPPRAAGDGLSRQRRRASRRRRGSSIRVQGGGRLIGEVCHMVDVLVDLAGAPVDSVFAQPSGADRGRRRAAEPGFRRWLDRHHRVRQRWRSQPAQGAARSARRRHVPPCSTISARCSCTPAAGPRASAAGLPHQDKGHAAELAAFVDAVRTGGRRPSTPRRRARHARDLRRRRVGADRTAGSALNRCASRTSATTSCLSQRRRRRACTSCARLGARGPCT